MSRARCSICDEPVRMCISRYYKIVPVLVEDLRRAGKLVRGGMPWFDPRVVEAHFAWQCRLRRRA